jgi:phage anti-repressor protein
MPDLIPFATRQLGNETINTVNARDLYAFLALTGDYNRWIKGAIKRAKLLEHVDFEVYYHQGENLQGGRPATGHHLSFDASKHISMMSSSNKGREARDWFIAKEKELAALTIAPKASEQFPELRAIAQLIESTAEARLLAQAAQEKAHAAELTAARAEGKADMALAEARVMTLEEFVVSNGLLRQMPEAQWPSYTRWLKDVCLAIGHDIDKGKVLGKRWQLENVYPLQALCALKHHEATKPRQMAMVRPIETPTPGGA